jgi:hypothetical protein
VNLYRKVKAGGRWMPEERRWYVRCGTIAGYQFENYIHIDSSKKRLIK